MMDYEPAENDPHLHDLPLAYAVALRLHGLGASDDDIARALGVGRESIPALLEVGRRKLADLRRHDA